MRAATARTSAPNRRAGPRADRRGDRSGPVDPGARGAARGRRRDDRLLVDTFKPELYWATPRGGDLLNSIWGATDGLTRRASRPDRPSSSCTTRRWRCTSATSWTKCSAMLWRRGRTLRARRHPSRTRDRRSGIGSADANTIWPGALDQLVALGFPTPGHLAQVDARRLTGRDVNERAFGTAATIALAAAAGIDVRVHDVAAQRDAARVTDAIVRGWRPNGWADTLP